MAPIPSPDWTGALPQALPRHPNAGRRATGGVLCGICVARHLRLSGGGCRGVWPHGNGAPSAPPPPPSPPPTPTRTYHISREHQAKNCRTLLHLHTRTCMCRALERPSCAPPPPPLTAMASLVPWETDGIPPPWLHYGPPESPPAVGCPPTAVASTAFGSHPTAGPAVTDANFPSFWFSIWLVATALGCSRG